MFFFHLFSYYSPEEETAEVDDEDMEMEAGGMSLEEAVTFRDPVQYDTTNNTTNNHHNTTGPAPGTNTHHNTAGTTSGSDPLSIPKSMHQFYNRSISSNEDNMSQGMYIYTVIKRVYTLCVCIRCIIPYSG